MNTDWKDGLISHLEGGLHCVLLRLICQLHWNELTFCHLFSYCDGGLGTNGPDSFKDPNGASLKGDLYLDQVLQFYIISTTLHELPELVWCDLSRDQTLL